MMCDAVGNHRDVSVKTRGTGITSVVYPQRVPKIVEHARSSYNCHDILLQFVIPQQKLLIRVLQRFN